MQNVIKIKSENKYKKENALIMNIDEYRKKIFEDGIEEKLLKAEEQIDNEKTIKAVEVFKELEGIYEF